MMNRKRLITFLFAGLAVLTLMVLSAGLSGMELQPARPFSIAGQEPQRVAGGAPTIDTVTFSTIWQIMTLLFIITLPFAVIHFILSPEGRKRVLRNTLLISLYAIFFLIFWRNLGQRPPLDLDLLPNGASGVEQIAIPDFFLNPPPLLIFAIGLLLVGASALVVYYLTRRRRTPLENELQVVAREARLALDDLRAGADVKDTVMRCYLQMTRALNTARGVQRGQAMTPREFETYLTRAGLHMQHVQRLTRLFEGARYSAHRPTSRDEREAEDCLQAIVEAYGSAA